MKGRRIQWRFGRAMLGWGMALAGGTMLMTWADWQRLSRGQGGDFALAIVAILFLGLGLWLGFATRDIHRPPAGNLAAVASLGITPREVEVLGLLAAGHSNKEIARAMGVSPNTVKTHLARLFVKLNATTRTAAIARARAINIVA